MSNKNGRGSRRDRKPHKQKRPVGKLSSEVMRLINELPAGGLKRDVQTDIANHCPISRLEALLSAQPKLKAHNGELTEFGHRTARKRERAVAGIVSG